MTIRRFLVALLLSMGLSGAYAATEVAPAVPDLQLPAEAEVKAASPAPKQAAPAVKQTAARAAQPAAKAKAAASKASAPKKAAAVPPVTNAAAKVNTEEIAVENLMPSVPAEQTPDKTAQAPAAQQADKTQPAQQPGANKAPAAPAPANGANGAQTPKPNANLIVYNPPTDRDPTLSPDDTLLIKHREEERLRALERERQERINAEKRRLAELERQRQLELERLRDPSREVRGKIRVNGIIGQEVFIGNKIYSVGKSVYGARIVKVLPDSVVFTYKGQQFTKKVDLK